MERPKIRDTDNVRLFYLSQFFIEYLLILYKREQGLRETDINKPPVDERILLGYVVIMAEMDSVKWVFGRMRMTMEDRVSTGAAGDEDPC